MKSESIDVNAARQRSVVAAAKAAGLLAGENGALGARVPQRLVAMAKERSGISSTTDLVEYALAKVALEDDFGNKLVARKGTIAADIVIEL
jgi:hypothetical protein